METPAAYALQFSKVVTLKDSKNLKFFCARSGSKSYVVTRNAKTKKYSSARDQVAVLKIKIKNAKGAVKKKLNAQLSALTARLSRQEKQCKGYFFPPKIVIPATLNKITRALTRDDLQYFLDKAGFGLSAREESLVDLGMSSGIDAFVDEFMRQKEEPSGLLSRVHDRLDGQLGNQTTQSPAGQRAALLDLWINTNNPFSEKFALFMLSVWTLGGDVIADETFRGEFWRYYGKLKDAVVNDTPLADLGVSITRDPLMLMYLNNDLNKKGSPNENYARELMELYTLGPVNLDGAANYTETQPDGSGDIAVAAKMLTGWKTQLNYSVNQITAQYDSSRHENGPHTMFAGKSYAFIGENDEDLVRGIFNYHPGVAIYYSREILKEYLTPNPPRELVESFAQVIQQSGFRLRIAMRVLFESEAFFSEQFKDTLPTNPLEYGVKVSRILGLFNGINANEAQRQIGNMGMQFNMSPSVFWYSQAGWLSPASQLERANFVAQILDDSTALAGVSPAWSAARVLPVGAATKAELINYISDKIGVRNVNSSQRATLNDYLSKKKEWNNTYSSFTYDNTNAAHQKLKGLGVYYLQFLTPEFQLR